MRWMIERKAISSDRELLQVVEIYAKGESKETVKRENREWTYEREKIT